MGLPEDFNSYHSMMNETRVAFDNLITKRIFNLDTAYREGIPDLGAFEYWEALHHVQA